MAQDKFGKLSPEELARLKASTPPPQGIDIAPPLNAVLNPKVSASTAKSWLDIAAPTLGSVAGATVGSRGGIRGALAGSSAGSALGEAAAMALYPALGLPLPTGEETARRMATAGATGAVGEGMAQGAFALGRKALRGASKKVDETGRWVADQLKEAVPEGGIVRRTVAHTLRSIPTPPTQWVAATFFPTEAPLLTPSQAAGTSLSQVVENILEGSFLGSGNVSKVKKAQQARVGGRVQELAGDTVGDELLGRMLQGNISQGIEGLTQRPVAPSPRELGSAIQRGLSMNKDAWFQFAGKQFDKARALGLPDVPLDDLSEFAQAQLKSAFAPEAMGKLYPTLQRLARAGETQLDDRLAQFADDPKMLDVVAKQLGIDATPAPKSLDAQSAADLASHLKSIVREDPRNEKMRGAAEQLLARLEATMERVGEEAAPEARHYYNLGRDLWRGGHEQFRTRFLESIADQYPSELGKTLLTKPVEVLEETLRAVPADVRSKVEQAAMRELLKDAPSPAAIQKAVDTFGEDRLVAVLGKDARRKLTEYQQLLVSEDADRLLGMATDTPSEFAKTIRARPVESLVNIRKLLSSPSRDALERSTLQHVLEGSDGQVASLKQVQDRLKALTPDRLTALVGPEAKQGLDELLTVMQKLNPTKDARGRVLIQLTQAGGAIRLAQAATLGAVGYTGGLTPESLSTAGVIVLGPAVLSKILMSPAGRNWLIQGVKAPPGSKMATRATNELLAFMAREGLVGDQGPLTPGMTAEVKLPPGGGGQ